LFFSCASLSNSSFFVPSINKQAASGHWITRPSENTIIIIGISSQHVKKDDDISEAKEDAARKVSMYHGIRGYIESFHNSGVNFFDYISDSKIELDYDTDFEKYIDQLSFDPKVDVINIDKSVFVRFKYSTASIHVDFTASLNENGRPNWTYSRDLPEIDEYMISVGFARNQVRLKDTIKKSTEAAAARLIEDMSAQIMSYDKSATGKGASSMIQTRSQGKLFNFQIIEFWIDPETGYVYTLAIAKQGN